MVITEGGSVYGGRWGGWEGGRARGGVLGHTAGWLAWSYACLKTQRSSNEINTCPHNKVSTLVEWLVMAMKHYWNS